MSKKSPKTKATKTYANAMEVWDVTIHDIRPVQELRDYLKTFSKKYCFQLERGEEEGKLHYQTRFSLKVKERDTGVYKRFKDWKAHVTLTSLENRDNMFYVMKEDTRVDGPWTDENEVYVPRDIRGIKELRPWQMTLKENLIKDDDRCVDILIDKDGNNGKTLFSRYMQIFHNAQIMPMVNDYKDLMRMAYSLREKKIFFIDMPRSIEKKKLKQLFGGIESLKGGYAYDDRYTFKQALFDPPRVCVFTNVEPKLEYLTKDRWRLWEIRNGMLEKYKPYEEKIEFVKESEEDPFSEGRIMGFSGATL